VKLIRASFRNFRLLKEIDVEFSVDGAKNITVLRAANESGKTTMLMGLQWGLFGDECLPDRGRTFRLHPLDSSTAAGTRVDISVSVDYEVAGRTGVRRYRLIRSAVETVNGQSWARESTSTQLFALSREGADPLDNPESHIRPHLPYELREVLFTDGDRALSFIEGARGEQTKRVEGAIRALLGLNVVEDAIKHVGVVSSAINKKVKSTAGNQVELERKTDQIALLEDEIPKLEEQRARSHKEVLNLEDLKQDSDQRLRDALRSGNRAELASELEKISRLWVRAEASVKSAAREHADLFKSQTLGKQLMAKDTLHDQKKIPNQTIPILEERLEQPTCICGESLSDSTPDGVRRRNSIKSLIEGSRNSDALQESVTSLYYGSRDLLSPVYGKGWIEEYATVYQRRQSALASLEDLGRQSRDLEARIETLPDVDISQLKSTRDLYSQKHLEAVRQEIELQSRVKERGERIAALKLELERLLSVDERGQQLLAELEVAKDLEAILVASLETMKTRELAQVSKRTNDLFLKMIGADPEQIEKAVIQQAEITNDFRIVVFGPNGRMLDPSQDLNGASRRALTIAFILALTRVSQVEAPNVIDTPLGMTSGYVKRAILSIAANQSAQLILFLTHDEIKGCEDILDEKAGRVYTMTNPAQYPKILVNPPPIADTRVILCKCSHRQTCAICQRKDNAVVEL
jgi:DNA sulfur modification protein DndD